MGRRSNIDREQSHRFERQIRKGRAKQQHLARKRRIIASWKLSKPEVKNLLEQTLSQHAGYLVVVKVEAFTITAIDGRRAGDGGGYLAEFTLEAKLGVDENVGLSE